MEKGKVNMSTFKEGFIKYGLDHGYIKPKKKSETYEEDDEVETQIKEQDQEKANHEADTINKGE